MHKRPLHILFVVDYFPSLSQVYILNAIIGLLDRGHQVSIFSFRHTSDRTVHPKINQYNLMQHVMYEKFPHNLPDCDIVFCQFGDLGQRILGMKHLSEWLQQRKLVVCLRGFDVAGYANNPFEVNHKLFNHIDLFLPVCGYFKKRLIKLGCPLNKIAVHHSAIDCSQFLFKTRIKPKNDCIHLISVGRLVKKKGIEFALRAFAQILKKYPNTHFTLIGDGPERANLELLIKRLNIKTKVTLYGWKCQEEVIALLDRSHIFLLPSITRANGNEEGIANALKEAMAMGLISIATWHAGTPELIDDGISGFMVPEKNSIALAQKIIHIIKNPKIWQSIGVSARQKIEKEFEIKKISQQLEKLFYKLLVMG
jgi:colanic acid/amylovoran biosynthesis glycosyltransferase